MNNNHKPFLTLMVGLPGSGKSTASGQYGWLVSTDAIREQLFGDESCQFDDRLLEDLKKKHPDWSSEQLDREARTTGTAQVFSRVNCEIQKALKDGRDVVLDATNLTRKSRKSMIRRFKDLARFRAVVVDPDLEVVLKRNAERSRHVPEDVIYRMAGQFQKPELDEGFDEIVEYETSDSKQNRKI